MANAPPADRTRSQPIPLAPLPRRGPSAALLPVPLTSFVGREREVEQVVALLRWGDIRLVTLTGPGGVGKTRLALRIADALAGAFPDGVALVSLAPITDPDRIVPTMARVLGVREVGDRSLAEQLTDALRERELLLVLDNFEQVVAAAPVVTDLLAACPQVRALVTSREVLRVSGEHAVTVPPLALPGDRSRHAQVVTESEAVRLFVERAQAARADFALTDVDAVAVAEIVRRLDGLPLALELGAARVAHLPPAALLARLERRLPLLTGGARDLPERQRTIRNTIAWSHDLLSLQEQTLFRRLAVFVGGLTLDAAEAVVVGLGDLGLDVFDGVASLVDKSLLRQELGSGGGSRYRMLETVWEFGLEQLGASGEEDAVRRRHAAVFVALVEQDMPAVGLPGPPARLPALEREDANLRVALGWAVERGETETGLRLVTALGGVWGTLGRFREERAWVEHVLALGGDEVPALRVLALAQLGWAALFLGDEAAVAVTVGHSEWAARLLSAAARLLDRMGTPLMTMHQAAYAHNLAAIRAVLGETAFQAAWAEGEVLPLAEAVAEAEAIFAEEEAQAPGGVVPPPASDPVALSGLSPRELEVVRLIATGCSNQDIADALSISHRTASTHVRNILTKLGLDNRAAVASWATRHHLA